MRIRAALMGGWALLIGGLAGCAQVAEPTPVPPASAPVSPPVAAAVVTLPNLVGRWVNPDRGHGSDVPGVNIASTGRVTVDNTSDPRRALGFAAVQDGQLTLRARYYPRRDICVAATPAPVQTLNCTVVEASRSPGPGTTYVLNRVQ